jgi:2-keto-4-pentenoate hydratase/2-oxohepta-3-ene-1,7-dioic acid hydratase in catechol pathway
VEHQIAYITSIMTLWPGDMIATGSQAGAGVAHTARVLAPRRRRGGIGRGNRNAAYAGRGGAGASGECSELKDTREAAQAA